MDKIALITQLSNSFDVLYVEDNAELRKETADFLKIFFPKLVFAVDGQEGLELALKNNYDLILTDIVMPKIDGITMIKEIQKVKKEQRFILISAYDDVKYFLESISLGVDGYILKPIELDQVLATFEKVISGINLSYENTIYQNKLHKLVDEQTQTIKENAQELINHSRIDTLTGLLNNSVLFNDVNTEDNPTLVIFDIIHFDAINKIYGYNYGDIVLKTTATILKEELPDNTLLYRIGCDEFACILPNLQKEEMKKIVENIFHKFDDELTINEDISIKVTLKAGISFSATSDNIINAKIALQESKNRHLPYSVYSENSKFITEQKETIFWMNKIKDALKYNLLVPFFQPITSNETQEVEKYEALARIVYTNDENETQVITPNKFIEAAKRTGLITDVTKAMVSKSFQIFSKLPHKLSLNITEDDLMADYIGEFLLSETKKYNINPEDVTVEILENVTTSGNEMILKQLEDLKSNGFKIAIDDFGTEGSNFGRLLDINVDYIKIDGKFIKNIDKDDKSKKIVQAMVLIANQIGATVVAEFVHNREVFETIQGLNVHYSQGYYFSEPKQNLVSEV